MLIGTTVNALAILAGSAVGLFFAHAARRGTGGSGLGERLRTTLMNGVALCVLYIGVSGCLDGQSTLTAIISMVLGALAGEMLDLDRRMQALGGLGYRDSCSHIRAGRNCRMPGTVRRHQCRTAGCDLEGISVCFRAACENRRRPADSGKFVGIVVPGAQKGLESSGISGGFVIAADGLCRFRSACQSESVFRLQGNMQGSADGNRCGDIVPAQT